MRWRLPLAALASLAVLVAGCPGRGDATAGGPSPTPTSSTSSPSAAVPALVGEWQRLQRCSELVGLLRKADMPAAVPEMLAEDGWVPGVDDPGQIDTRHPVPRRGRPPALPLLHLGRSVRVPRRDRGAGRRRTVPARRRRPL